MGLKTKIFLINYEYLKCYWHYLLFKKFIITGISFLNLKVSKESAIQGLHEDISSFTDLKLDITFLIK